MNLQSRVINILTKPEAEWAVIAAEPTDVASLYTNYIVILAAVPALCTFLGLAMFGLPLLGSLGFGYALRAACMSYVGSLLGVYIAALIIEKLAPNFGSSGSTVQALKLVAYAYTPVWVAGVFHLLPVLGVLILIAALYSIYLFYLGLTPVMKTPPDKVVPFMVVSALVIIAVSVLLSLVLGAIVGMGGYSGYGRFG